jgi:hypothetical protein
MLNIFAFDYYYPFDNETELYVNGWDIYKEPLLEFERQGIDFKNPVSIFENLRRCYRVASSRSFIIRTMRFAQPIQ